ncbi:MAG: pyridoxamine 5'-phosphate oxidase family protein [Firmicutes bacterium]|nr:pyridoxamine 5'-phosphate oxidase family protein [Bacillota bacterium]
MAKITPKMKEMIEKQQCFVATADKNGVPNVGPKGSTTVLDDETIAFAEIVGKKTYENIKANPRVAIAAVDRAARAGFRFVGTASMETSGPVFDAFAEKLKAMEIPKTLAVVKVKVEEIYDMSVKNPGGKIE